MPRRRRWARLATIVLIALGVGPLAPPQAMGQQEPPPASSDEQLIEVIEVYRSLYPDVASSDLEARVAQEPVRDALLTEFIDRYDAELTGSSYDLPQDVWHLYVTTATAADEMAQAAADKSIQTETHLVAYGFHELEAKADEIRAGTHPLSLAAAGRVGIDPEAAQVVVQVSPDDYTRLTTDGAADDPMVTVTPTDPTTGSAQPVVCLGRFACGRPLRGGIVLWAGAPDQFACSLGFTATAANGSRWVLTAGHCVTRIGQTWGHGERGIGPAVQQAQFPGSRPNVDAALIRIDSSYWRGAPGGYLFSPPASAVDVDGAISDMRQIVRGQVACYSGWSAVVHQNCGPITNVSDPAQHGMPRVESVDICTGDSGGSVIRLTTQGRIAIGMASVARFASPFDRCGDETLMWFSPAPAFLGYINAINPSLGLRIDVR